MLIRRLLVAACGLVLVSAPSFGQSAATNKDMELSLIKQTHDLTTSEINADMPTLDRIFTDDFTKTAASVARVAAKSEFLEGLKVGKQKYISFEFSNESAHVYDGSGIVTANIHFKVINGSNPVADNYEILTAVWVKQGGTWQCAAWITYRNPNPPSTN